MLHIADCCMVEWSFKIKRNQYDFGSSLYGDCCYLFQVLFKEKVFLTEVNVYETYHSGGTKRIRAKDPAGNWDTIYEAQQVECHKKSRIFSPAIKV